MQPGKPEIEACECGGVVCVHCEHHLLKDTTFCAACLAVDALDSGDLSEEDCREITAALDKAEADAMACPECSDGRPCAPVCDECQMSEMGDRLRHESSHGPGSF